MAECVYEEQRFIPPKDPSKGGLPAGGEPGQVLTIDDNGNPVWTAGGGGGGSVTLYNTTGQSTTGGMTQKAITDALDGKADKSALDGKADKSALTGYVEKETGKGLSTNDFTDADKTKLAGLSNYDDTALAGRVTQAESDIDALETAVDNKVDKETGKGLSSNDFTDADASKLSGLANIKSVGTGLSLDATTGELTATGGTGGGATSLQEIFEDNAEQNVSVSGAVIHFGDATTDDDASTSNDMYLALSGAFFESGYTPTEQAEAKENIRAKVTLEGLEYLRDVYDQQDEDTYASTAYLFGNQGLLLSYVNTGLYGHAEKTSYFNMVLDEQGDQPLVRMSDDVKSDFRSALGIETIADYTDEIDVILAA